MLLTQQDIYIRAGSTETFTVTVTVTDANGAAVDCTGVTLRMQIRDGAAGGCWQTRPAHGPTQQAAAARLDLSGLDIRRWHGGDFYENRRQKRHD